MKFDLKTLINVDRAIDPVVATNNTAETGQIIDTKGYESLTFVIAVGDIADSDATLTPSLEDGDESDLSDTAAVADAFLIGTEAEAAFAAGDDNETRWIGYNGNKRYVRLTLTPAANTGNLPLSAVAIKGNPLTAPTTIDS